MRALQLESDNLANQFIQTFAKFSQTNTLTDVTLVSDDRIRIEAHKIVLCAGSSMFQDFFVNNTHGHPLLYLRGIKHQELKSVLEFLYNGTTRIPQMEVDKFLEVAKELEVFGLESETDGIVNTFNNFENEDKSDSKVNKVKTQKESACNRVHITVTQSTVHCTLHQNSI